MMEEHQVCKNLKPYHDLKRTLISCSWVNYLQIYVSIIQSKAKLNSINPEPITSMLLSIPSPSIIGDNLTVL